MWPIETKLSQELKLRGLCVVFKHHVDSFAYSKWTPWVYSTVKLLSLACLVGLDGTMYVLGDGQLCHLWSWAAERLDKETVVSRLQGSDLESEMMYARASQIVVYAARRIPTKDFKRLQDPSKQLASAWFRISNIIRHEDESAQGWQSAPG